MARSDSDQDHALLTHGTPSNSSTFQDVREEDIEAVVEVLRSDWLTTGPMVDQFEQLFCQVTNSDYAVAVSNGTAALHAAVFAADIKPGDEVIVPAITFVATANTVIYQGGIPVFADVEPETLLIDPQRVESLITSRTKAIVAVDFAGHPADYDALSRIASANNLTLIADACHSLGGSIQGQPVGSLADLSCFSFHPQKHITCGEGGMVSTNNSQFAQKMKMFRNHGVNLDFRQRAEKATHRYEMHELGWNYRLSDMQCALGWSQLKRLEPNVQRRLKIARDYEKALEGVSGVELLQVKENVQHAYHLFVIKLHSEKDTSLRDKAFVALRELGIPANVHYEPIYLHPYYHKKFGSREGLCPIAEAEYGRILSLPVFEKLSPQVPSQVRACLENILE